MLKLDGPGLVVRRFPELDDDPDLTLVAIAATNGRSSLSTEIYLQAGKLRELGPALAGFPRSPIDRWEVSFGDANRGSFLRIRAFTWGPKRDCALGFEAVTNGDEVVRSSVEFAMAVEAAALYRLGPLLNEFAELRHIDLHWPGSDGQLFEYARLDLAR